MNAPTRALPGLRWIGGLVDAVARVFAFRRGPSPRVGHAPSARRPARRRRTPIARRVADVQKLAAAGLDACEISRRTRLSRDAVTLLLTRVPGEPDVSAGRGRSFRIIRPLRAS